MKEEIALFGASKSLVGIVSMPAGECRKAEARAVLLLNPGIVHRVGPGRIYVRIARELASRGFVVLRFDLSGIGDSAVRLDNLPFSKSAVSETREAMDLLQRKFGIQTFVLMGGCSGARVAFDAAVMDPRVIGAVPINFPVVNEDEELDPALNAQRTAHYYWSSALFKLSSWRKLLTGKANYRNVLRAVRSKVFNSRSDASPGAVPFRNELQSLVRRGVHLSFLYSGTDPRLAELRQMAGSELKRLLASGCVELEVIRRADHTFSSAEDQQRLISAVCRLVNAISPPPERQIDAKAARRRSLEPALLS